MEKYKIGNNYKYVHDTTLSANVITGADNSCFAGASTSSHDASINPANNKRIKLLDIIEEKSNNALMGSRVVDYLFICLVCSC